MCWRGQIIDEKGISMNRIVFMSENRRIIEQITAVLNATSDMNFQLLSTSRLSEALNDIRAFKADLVIIDGLQEGVSERISDILQKIRMVDSVSKCILLADAEALQSLGDCTGTLYDEYVLYDEHLEQLFNKLAEYRDI